MSFRNALSTFNANHSGIGSRRFRDDNEHGHTYHESHKENVAPQLSILSTYLRDSSLPKAPLQVRHALDFAIGFFCDPQSFPLHPTTNFNHPVLFDTSLLPIRASATAPGHQLLPSPTDPTSIDYNIQINRQTTLNILYHHPINALVEYPETSENGRVGHIFTLDPSTWINPYLNFAYSLGGSHGSSKKGTSVAVSVLVDESGENVPCREMHTTCEYYLLYDLYDFSYAVHA